MTIRKRLRISYSLLVVIPFLFFLVVFHTLKEYNYWKLGELKLSVQTKEFNREFYNIIGKDAKSLLEMETLKMLINQTADPSSIIGYVLIDGVIITTTGNPEEQIFEGFSDVKYVNYWLFNIDENKRGEIFFINLNYSNNKEHITLIFPIIFYILLISLLSIITSRKITKPLKKLKDAAISIKNEEFDIKLNYCGEDEISDVFTAFDDMRVRLKHIVEKQLRYEKNRTELITNISHDLRTPITAIKGYIEGLVDGVANTPEKIIRYHETIYKKITLLDKLIENLFLYSRLDLKTISFHFQKLDLNLFISDILEEIRYDEPQMDIIFIKSDTRISVLADPIQLQRVIHNLIGNSKKYCNKKICKVKINLQQERDKVRISLVDNGIGISQKNVKDMFKRFYRSDPARSSTTEGSGLGLAISKQIISEHNGEIFANNNLKEGLTVTFILPVSKE